MLTVILIWNAFHPSPLAVVNGNEIPITTGSTQLPPLSKKTIEIQSVYMPGEMDYEKINLKNVGDIPIDISGWTLSNASKEKFTFPSLTIYPNGAVDVYSAPGVNSAVELFWNAPAAVWKSGEEAVLLDNTAQERSRYLIP
jgi:micrococcal nuclease